MLIPSLRRKLTARACSLLAAGITGNIVYLGGSITDGTAAAAGKSWRALTGAWLDAIYPASTLTHINAGVGGTDSWYGLTRLTADCIAHAPELVFIDFAVNDSTYAWSQPSAEALVRRLRTSLPNATLLAHFNLQVANHSSSVNVKDTVRAWWLPLCQYYRLPFVDVRTLVQAAVANGDFTLDDYFSDNVHPNNFGHEKIHEWQRRVLGPRRSADTTLYHRALAECGYMHASTPNYEAPPIAIDGADADSTTGTWTTVDTAIESTDSATPATATFSGTFCSFSLEVGVDDTAVVAYSIDGGAFVEYPLYSLAHGATAMASMARAAHTVVFKVVSGTVRIVQFLAV